MENSTIDLAQLAVEICQEPPGSPLRQRKLTLMIRTVSRKLWKENSPHYSDALQDTYVFLCRRLCDLYDPEKANVTTWLNSHLKWRIFSLRQKEIEDAAKRVYMPNSPEDGLDPIANIPSPPPAEYSLMDAVRDWATEDKSGELRSIYMKKYPYVTAQVMILRRLPPDETKWSDLSNEFGAPLPALASFHQRHCVQLLRNFVENEDIDS